MSRQRPGKPMREFVYLDLICGRCEGRLGRLLQFRSGHPRAGECHLEDTRGADQVLGPRGWKVTAVCSDCGAKPQAAWDKLLTALDQLDETSRYRVPYVL